jgi:hypothetical protein
MDKFTEMMLAKTGLISMIGKAERGPTAIEAIRAHKSAYLMAVGGSAYLVSKAIRNAKVVAFEDLGHGSHLRVRGSGYACDRGCGFARRVRAQHWPCRVAQAYCRDLFGRCVRREVGSLGFPALSMTKPA